MRTAHQEVKFLKTDSGQLLGVSLGYDYCAEHEWGTKGIRSALGVTQGVDTSLAYTEYPTMADSFPASLESFRAKPSTLYSIKGSLSLAKTKTSWFDKKALAAKKIEFGDAQKAQTGKKTVKWIKSLDFVVFGCYQYESEIVSSLEFAAKQVVKALKLKEGQAVPEFADFYSIKKDEIGFIEVEIHPAYAEKFYEEMTSGQRVDSPSLVAYRPDTKWGIRDLSSQWCGDRFEFLAVGPQACSDLNQVMQAVRDQKAFYGIAPVLNPFARSGPLLMLEAGLSAEEVDAINASLQAAKQEAAEIYQQFHIVLTAIKERKQNIGYISIKKRAENDFAVWLNPGDSQKYNYGWFSAADLEQLLDNKGPILKTQSV